MDRVLVGLKAAVMMIGLVLVSSPTAHGKASKVHPDPDEAVQRLIALYQSFPRGEEVIQYLACRSSTSLVRERRPDSFLNTSNWTLYAAEALFDAPQSTLDAIQALRREFGTDEFLLRVAVDTWAHEQVQFDNQIDDCERILSRYASFEETIAGRYSWPDVAKPFALHPDAMEHAQLARRVYLEEAGQAAWDYSVCYLHTRRESAPTLPPGNGVQFSRPSSFADTESQSRIGHRFSQYHEQLDASGLLHDLQSQLIALEAITAERYSVLGKEWCDEQLLAHTTTLEERMTRLE